MTGVVMAFFEKYPFRVPNLPLLCITISVRINKKVYKGYI